MIAAGFRSKLCCGLMTAFTHSAVPLTPLLLTLPLNCPSVVWGWRGAHPEQELGIPGALEPSPGCSPGGLTPAATSARTLGQQQELSLTLGGGVQPALGWVQRWQARGEEGVAARGWLTTGLPHTRCSAGESVEPREGGSVSTGNSASARLRGVGSWWWWGVLQPSLLKICSENQGKPPSQDVTAAPSGECLAPPRARGCVELWDSRF